MKFSLVSTLVATAVVLSLLDSSVVAMIDEKHNKVEERVTAENWPSDGAWIVSLKSSTGHEKFVEAARSVHERMQLSERKEFKVKHTFINEIGGLNAVVIEGIHSSDIKKIKGVTSIYPDLMRYATAYSWGIDRSDQANLPLLRNSWNPDFVGCGVDVYVLDTGVDTLHPEFAATGNGRTVENIWNGFGSVVGNTDGNGHGSHCAGTVGGNTIGISPCVNIYGMKVLSDAGSGSTSGILSALNEVTRRHIAGGSGAKSIVSMSLGGGCSGSCLNDPMVLKIQELVQVGIISAVAAGNDNADASLSSPAAAPDAITVGASSITDGKAGFSNYGASVDIQAPGVNIVSVCSSLNTACSGGSGSQYWTISGTSMACPHVAGALAQQLLKAPGPMVNADAVAQVRASLLCDSAKNKITGLPADTTNDLLQIPVDDGRWACNVVTPMHAPTAAPSTYPAFSPYSASATNSATTATVNEDIYVCPGAQLTFSLCSADGASCVGDTFLRLFDAANTQISFNDDSCGICASITYSFTAPCQTYSLHQGCYGSGTCGGTTSITVITASPPIVATTNPSLAPASTPTLAPISSPTKAPTRNPTNSPVADTTLAPISNPTKAPTRNPTNSPVADTTLAPISNPTKAPTRNPTDSPVATVPTNVPQAAPSAPTYPTSFPEYSASATNSATTATVNEDIYVCPGAQLTFSLCSADGASCVGDTFLRLFDAANTQISFNDDSCGFCASITHSFTAPCQTYSLHQGCYGSGTCGGIVQIIDQTPPPVPSAAPVVATTVVPTGPSIPSEFPAYTATNTRNARRNTVDTAFDICPGTTLTFSLCSAYGASCSGDTYLRLFDAANTQISFNDDSCGICASITFSFTAPCQTYSLHQGCYSSGTCGGTIVVRESNADSMHIEEQLQDVSTLTAAEQEMVEVAIMQKKQRTYAEIQTGRKLLRGEAKN